ncbi:diphthine--ammonia ligase isoform X1 [Conger conger]|uniref:diphthine--ammonia ligase isoform X1 n=1 Tax=Conger conger TaxID=82655 RepID=UPI002A5A3084|nr:diphthine--ammonia ligase isoform X1 [Conger conger]
MKVVALISGGKDSCYNMMQCVAAGHRIVALANLRPKENTDELDSYMYQTVGHQAIDVYAEAMDLPLYRRTIEGSSLNTGMEYTQREGDEVEDLYHLLKLVQEKEGVEAVSVGAILSDYQRVRVENVCTRLRLQPLAYLWRRDQEALLGEMVSRDVHALIIKVAAFGLDPEKHLGRTLGEMEPYLKQLSKKYGVHVCGEGGEYETFTLDCPLFKKKIVIDSMETVIHSADAFAPVGYLRFSKMHLEEKTSSSASPLDSCPCLKSIDEMTEERVYADEHGSQGEAASLPDLPCHSDCELLTSCSARTALGYQWLCGISGPQCDQPDIQNQTRQAFALLQDEVQKRGLGLKHIVLVHLYVQSMESFSSVNAVYQSYFGLNPPARVCVEAPLPKGQLLQMDCLLHDWIGTAPDDTSRHKQAMHVQSLSHWAPANIGPYSQAFKVDEVVFCAGQIALVPCTMELLQGGAGRQASLSFAHTERVLAAMGGGLTLGHALQPHCYVTHGDDVPAVRRAWERKLEELRAGEESCGEEAPQCGPLVVVVVPRLPRGAAVELHVVGSQDEPRRRSSSRVATQTPCGTIECQTLQSSTRQSATVSLSLTLLRPPSGTDGEEGLLRALRDAFRDAVRELGRSPPPLCVRTFYKHDSALAQKLAAGLARCLKDTPEEETGPAVALVPVLDLPDSRILHLSCWLSA